MTDDYDPQADSIGSYAYDIDCYLPDGPADWWCPFGHERYRDDCWGCRY